MAISVFTVFLVIFSVFGVKGQNSCKTCDDMGPIDYYWRDYVGTIPCDAIVGGMDTSGNPTYIGQIFFKDYELLPAFIRRGSRTATTCAYDLELTSEKNIKILCSNNKERYQWVKTKSEEIQLLTSFHLVIGGTEVGAQLNIGRVKYENEVVIGKVFSYPLPNHGLFIPSNGHPVRFDQYEILTYNCNFNDFCSCNNTCIDVRSKAIDDYRQIE